MTYNHICGLYYWVHDVDSDIRVVRTRKYLPQVHISVHSTILATTSRTTLTQNFINPESDKPIPELRYTFPLYDGVSVVGFTCTINKDRVIRGVVQERNEARKTYDQAIAKGETAGLLEQLPAASDVFTTTVGNVPGGAEIKVEITYLGELKQDAEGEGSIRFTIPTSIAPRYGDYPGELLKGTNVSTTQGISITVDAEMPAGSKIKSVQSPSHPISVTIGNTSTGAVSGAEMSLEKASATLSLATTELDKDFVLQVVATDSGNPLAVLETHPTLPNHRAIMATLVPKFNLPSSRPEIVFLCDRSGSMGDGQRIPHLAAAVRMFLKSLPLGVKFNICSFGSRHEFLFREGSVSYDASSVDKAMNYANSFAANFGGTVIAQPLKDIIEKRHKDMDLEIFLLTDGQVWRQEELNSIVNEAVEASRGRIRLFTLGIGDSVSHSLIEGLARAGNGFAQTVVDNERMNSKVLRMLKAALTPHVTDYSLEIKYGTQAEAEDEDMDFEIVEKVMDALAIDTQYVDPEAGGDKGKPKNPEQKTTSLFDPTADPDAGMEDPSRDTTAGGKYAGVPPVPEPKLLQAPFKIPSLYSFNRTTIYVLLSPETTQKTPKSVVLRGTSAHGPLELEIPITALPDKAETIHQLAARKAIRELEDGRGWIFHAKHSGDGVLLKEKFPGRFVDMVEREAVRLGVVFQVGGKWCSFVAVEDGVVTQQPEDGQPQQLPAFHAMGGDASYLQYQASPQSDLRAGGYSSLARMSPATERGKGGSFESSSRGMGDSAKPMPSFRHSPAKRTIRSKNLAASAAPAPLPMSGATFDMSVDSYSYTPSPASIPVGLIDQPYGRSGSRQAPVASFTPMGSSAALSAGLRPRGFAAGVPKPRQSPKSDTRATESYDPTIEFVDDSAPPAPPADPLDALVMFQTFEGSWKWEEKVFEALKLNVGMVFSRMQSADKTSAEALEGMREDGLLTTGDKLATACVLAWLEVRLGDRRDEWEMMADKALRWLEGSVKKGKVGDYVAAVRDVVAGCVEAGPCSTCG